jgi:hypothetical protein
MDGVFPFGIFGVKTAVDAFVKGHGLKLYVTGGKHEESLSWFLFKPPE